MMSTEGTAISEASTMEGGGQGLEPQENRDIARESLELFRPLQVEDSDLRASSIHQVIHNLYALEQDEESGADQQAETPNSGGGYTRQASGESADTEDTAYTGKVYRGIERLEQLLPAAVRITCECPFVDVVDAMSEYLSHVHHDLGLSVPEPPSTLSKFFTEPEIPLPCRTEDRMVHQLYVKSYLTFGRVSHYEQLLSFHKSYLERWINILNALMRQDGPLPRSWRHYIAAMAGSRFHCAYVVNRQRQLFVAEGGDPTWLSGLNEAPLKLKALAELNALLAHRPWKIDPEHIEVLVDGGTIAATNAVRLDFIPMPTSRHSRRRWIRAQLQEKLDEKLKELGTEGGDTAKEDGNSEITTLKAAADRLLYEENHTDSDMTLSEVKYLKENVLKPRRHPHVSPKPAPPSQLTFPSFTLSQSDTWTMNELTHAIVIMTTFHGVASLAHSMSLQLECDLDDSMIINNFERGPVGENKSEDSKPTHIVSEKKRRRPLKDKLKTGVFEEDYPEGVEEKSATSESEAEPEYDTACSSANGPKEQKSKHDPFEQAGRTPEAPVYEPKAASDDYKYSYYEKLHALPLRYRDFDTSEGIFRTQDFSWEQHGFSLLSRFYPLLAPLVDDQFKHTYELTYHTLAGEGGINTQPFRTAVWYYVHRLFGTINDDYNYKSVNTLMYPPTKSFIKQAVCSPETITEESFDGIEGDMGPDEKCHIGLLSIEAKKQASLLYALHAMMKYFK
eukprot:gb/GECG01016673.1/.p1 GENE.gb/GECG01016673.1/~~gb/GECG01016673.1/.p1  ORF type:complete len:733 (+),score=88.35 gb/GECG01016673.1/:1-2199(+)